MKKITLLPLMFAGSLSLAAEMPIAPPKDLNKVETSVTKITCSQDVIYVLIDKDGKETLYRDEDASSESTRTTWKDGDIEYRFSESFAYEKGKKPNVKSRSMVKVIEKRDGNRLTIETEGQSVSWNLIDGVYYSESGSKTKHSKFTSVDVYEVHGNKKTLVTATLNGKPEHAGDVETEYVISPKKKMITYVAKTPYTQDLDKGQKLRIEKSETTCLFETK